MHCMTAKSTSTVNLLCFSRRCLVSFILVGGAEMVAEENTMSECESVQNHIALREALECSLISHYNHDCSSSCF